MSEELVTVITQLYHQGYSAQELLAQVEETCSPEEKALVLSVLAQMEFASSLTRQVVTFDRNYLFAILFNAYKSGMEPIDILQSCASCCNREDFAFCQVALDHIEVYYEPSEDEIKAFRLKLYEKYIAGETAEKVMKFAETIKNVHLRRLCSQAAGVIARNKVSLKSESKKVQITDGEEVKVAVNTDEFGGRLIETLEEFKIKAAFVSASSGPTFHRYKIQLSKGVRFKTLKDIGEDLVQSSVLGLSARPMIAVVPGGVAVDIPRPDRQIANFLDYVDITSPIDIHKLTIPGGIDVDGNYVEIPLSDEHITHILGGGMTRAGKSQFEKVAVLSILLRYPPSICKLALSDVKRVTFGSFKDLPHLIVPVAKEASSTLLLLMRLVKDQDLRYKEFERCGVENIGEYNRKFPNMPMTRNVCFIDEVFDLLSDDGYSDDIEKQLMKLLAKAGAAGIHIILFTQRPDKDVIKPLIRSNCPAKIALRVSRPEDSGIILADSNDDRAVDLLGYGDLLFKSVDGVQRLQGLYVSNEQMGEMLTERMKTLIDPFTAWAPGILDSQSVETGKAIPIPSITPLKSSNIEMVEEKVDFDEPTKQQIFQLYSSSQDVNGVIKALFGLTRKDRDRYKAFRTAVNDLLSLSQEEQD